MTDTTHEALSALVSLVMREAPHLSGKVLCQAIAALAHPPQPEAQPVDYEPMLVVDIARELGRSAAEVCAALRRLGLGDYSVNMAIPRHAAREVRTHLAQQPEAQPAATPATAGQTLSDGDVAAAVSALVGCSPSAWGRIHSDVIVQAFREVLTQQPAPSAACQGANCGSTDGLTHSAECLAETDAHFTSMGFPAPSAEAVVGWLYEDTLPEGYPYDAMFKHSAIRDGVRMFPVFAPTTPSTGGDK